MKQLAPATRAALAKQVRLLSSPVAGEVLATVGAIARTLKSVGGDIHDLAAIIEAPAIAPGGSAGNGDYSDDDDPAEVWEMMVDACIDRLEQFTFKEQGFLQSMQDWVGTPTPRQINWLVALFERVQRAA